MYTCICAYTHQTLKHPKPSTNSNPNPHPLPFPLSTLSLAAMPCGARTCMTVPAPTPPKVLTRKACVKSCPSCVGMNGSACMGLTTALPTPPSAHSTPQPPYLLPTTPPPPGWLCDDGRSVAGVGGQDAVCYGEWCGQGVKACVDEETATPTICIPHLLIPHQPSQHARTGNHHPPSLPTCTNGTPPMPDAKTYHLTYLATACPSAGMEECSTVTCTPLPSHAFLPSV